MANIYNRRPKDSPGDSESIEGLSQFLYYMGIMNGHTTKYQLRTDEDIDRRRR